MQKKAYDLEFQPKERRRRDQALRFLGGFCAIVLLLGIVSAIALQRDGLVDQILDALRPTEAPTDPPEGAWTYTGSALILLCGTDNAGQSLRFCALARVDVTQRQLHVFPLSPRAMAPWDGREASLEQTLREGGPKALKAAVEALTEGAVDRYICSDDKGFVTAVNLMGSVTVQVPRSIRYSGADFTLTLAEGSQRLQGDMLLRYFRYLGTLEPTPTNPSDSPGTPGSGAALAQGELLKRVLETYLAKPMDARQLEARFNSLMNVPLDTDISVNDFFTRLDMLLAILANGDQFTVDVKE